MKSKIFILLILFALSLELAFSTRSAVAASITVNSLLDTIAVDSQCTLREAINNANNNAATYTDCAAGSGTDTITFNLSGTITLGSALPTINDSAGTTLDGSGQTMIINGNNAVRVMYAGNTLTVNHLTIANGNATGGVTGGGIYHGSNGTLTILDSTFIENYVGQGAAGGAIYNAAGMLTITNSQFISNTATAKGGGIYNDSDSMTITKSTFSGNNAPGGGWPSGGGGIYNNSAGTLTITGSTFSENSSEFGGGGGIHCYNCTLNILNSIFTGNTASSGGGIYHLYEDSGLSTIRNSTFSNNSANTTSSSSGGGIYNGNDAELAIANSTFYGNSAVYGGGIYNNNASLTVANSTFYGNSATTSGGGVSKYFGTVTLGNTILANNTGGNCSGSIANGGNNLEDATTCDWGSASGSMSSTDPLLGDLTGSPAYYPLLASSPAIDAGDDAICAAAPVDNQSQNGLIRPQNDHCDIGSYEYPDTTPPVVISITVSETQLHNLTEIIFILTFSENVTGVDSNDFGLIVTGLSGESITGVNGAGSEYTISVDPGSGSGTIRLDVLDDDSILDLALNPLGGEGLGNGNFTEGETWETGIHQVYLPLILDE